MAIRHTRRQFLKTATAALSTLAVWRCSQSRGVAATSTAQQMTEGNPSVQSLPQVDHSQSISRAALEQLWAQADVLEHSIRRTQFGKHQFLIGEFGAKTGDVSDLTLARHNRQALQQAIDACHQAGGGVVIVPAGVWPTGALRLRSHVCLQIAQGALLQFHPATELYLPLVPTRWEGLELMGYQPLIYAYQAENIALVGQGRIDGGASNTAWWPWKGEWKHTPWQINTAQTQQQGRNQLMLWAEQQVPIQERVLAENFLRPPLVQVNECQRVLIEDVTLTNSPFWLIHPLLSDDVIVRGVKCHSHGPNSDGCDPESCRRVLIEHCEFDTGDDCIALKSGRNADGRRVNRPVEQILIQHCTMQAGHGGVVIGSEISGGARKIFARDLTMSSPDLERGLRIKTNATRGGLIEDIALRDIVIGQVKDAIVINYFYEEAEQGDYLPRVRNLNIHNLVIQQAERLFELRGFAKSPIGQIYLSRVQANCQHIGELSQVQPIAVQDVLVNGKSWRMDGATQ